jgi:hypothetical protein
MYYMYDRYEVSKNFMYVDRLKISTLFNSLVAALVE